jgi:uncharacterized protein YecE (DUF72 family)
MQRAYVGTSGWSYRSWEGTFYPSGVPKTRHFDFYASRFPTVEINLTFYRLPTPNMVQNWRDKAPAGFVYAIKGSRFITHMLKLLNADEALDRFFSAIQPLHRKIGVILWQLPPFLTKDLPRLDRFLARLPKTYDYAVEFRHLSWVSKDVVAVLRRHRMAFVSVSSCAMPMDLTVTADPVYIRFHGLAAGAAHDYTNSELEPWADHILNQVGRGHRVFAFFNNDVNARAPANAKTLMEMIGSVSRQ